MLEKTMVITDLSKVRSMTACMKASYQAMTCDIRKTAKQTWITHVPFAILLTIVFYFLLPNKSLHDWGELNPLSSFILQSAVYLATIVMAIVAFVYTLPVKQIRQTGTQQKKKLMALRVLRHFGGFLLTAFLGIMILCMVTIVAALPSIIITIAQLYSQLGALEGDPLGVPSYFTPLLFVVFFITSLLLVYALTWLGITFAYQYSSYKIQDEERLKMKESQREADTETEKHPSYLT